MFVHNLAPNFNYKDPLGIFSLSHLSFSLILFPSCIQLPATERISKTQISQHYLNVVTYLRSTVAPHCLADSTYTSLLGIQMLLPYIPPPSLLRLFSTHAGLANLPPFSHPASCKFPPSCLCSCQPPTWNAQPSPPWPCQAHCFFSDTAQGSLSPEAFSDHHVSRPPSTPLRGCFSETPSLLFHCGFRVSAFPSCIVNTADIGTKISDSWLILVHIVSA